MDERNRHRNLPSCIPRDDSPKTGQKRDVNPSWPPAIIGPRYLPASLRLQKRRRCCRATRNHHRLPPPGAPTGNAPQRRHARPPAFPHTPSQPSSRDDSNVKEDRCWCRRLGSSIFIRDCAATKISAATTGWRLGFPWSCPGRLCLVVWRFMPAGGGSKSTTAMASSDRRWDARIPSQLHCQRRCNETTTTTMEAMQDASWIDVEESLRLVKRFADRVECRWRFSSSRESALSAERAHLDAASVRPGVDRFNCRFWTEPGDVD